MLEKFQNLNISEVIIRALNEMGRCGGGFHTVLKQKIADLNRGKQMRIANAHVSFPPCSRKCSGAIIYCYYIERFNCLQSSTWLFCNSLCDFR